MKGIIPFVDPAQFNNIDETAIARAISTKRGSAGPSGADADQWRRMLMSQNYSSDGTDLRTAIAEVAKNCAQTISILRMANWMHMWHVVLSHSTKTVQGEYDQLG